MEKVKTDCLGLVNKVCRSLVVNGFDVDSGMRRAHIGVYLIGGCYV